MLAAATASAAMGRLLPDGGSSHSEGTSHTRTDLSHSHAWVWIGSAKPCAFEAESHSGHSRQKQKGSKRAECRQTSARSAGLIHLLVQFTETPCQLFVQIHCESRN